mmetsp:Transcript_4718/g.12111  ORF Transcript_4718/g.12111 Transcript_4718/m.12111 type:complete len:99 (-) Transcript_4718:75-371(-)
MLALAAPAADAPVSKKNMRPSDNIVDVVDILEYGEDCRRQDPHGCAQGVHQRSHRCSCSVSCDDDEAGDAPRSSDDEAAPAMSMNLRDDGVYSTKVRL